MAGYAFGYPPYIKLSLRGRQRRNPESITTPHQDGLRVRGNAAPRNDGVSQRAQGALSEAHCALLALRAVVKKCL